MTVAVTATIFLGADALTGQFTHRTEDGSTVQQPFDVPFAGVTSLTELNPATTDRAMQVLDGGIRRFAQWAGLDVDRCHGWHVLAKSLDGLVAMVQIDFDNPHCEHGFLRVGRCPVDPDTAH